jgi:hypothetical protein
MPDMLPFRKKKARKVNENERLRYACIPNAESVVTPCTLV